MYMMHHCSQLATAVRGEQCFDAQNEILFYNTLILLAKLNMTNMITKTKKQQQRQRQKEQN